MKRAFFSTLLCVVTFALTTAIAAAEIADSTFASVNLTTAGTLSTVLKAQGYDLTRITRVVVTGKINSRDFNTLGKTMVNLTDIDVSGTDATVIPDETFKDRQQLKTFKAPASVHKIGNSAFTNCNQLTTYTFTAGIDSIGENAFYACYALKDSIRFSETLSCLGNGAFGYCSSLKQVDMSASTTLTTMGGMAFYACTQLTTVLLPNSLNSFQWGTFYNCSALVEIDLSGCTNLVALNGGDTFAECRQLKRVSLPPSLTAIGSEFRGCSALERFTMLSSTVPSTTTTTFGDIPLSTCVLYVPIGSEAAYFNAPNWFFETIIGVGVLPTIGAHGSVKANGVRLANGKVFFHNQQAVLLEFIPEPGYKVDRLLVNGSQVQLTNNTYQLQAGVVGATIEATFKIKQYQLTIRTAGNGVVIYKGKTLNTPYAMLLDSATSANFVLKPEVGSVIDSVFFNGLPCIVQQDSLFYAPKLTDDATLVVKFASASAVGTLYRYTVETGTHGSIMYKNTPLLASTSVAVKAGESALFTLLPEDRYILDKLTVNGVDVTAAVVNHTYTVENATADASLSASFRINPVASVNVEVPGTLSSYFFSEQCGELTTLTITGRMDRSDLFFIRDSLKNLRRIDMQQVVIEGEGRNKIPNYALSNLSNLSTIILPSTLWGIGYNAFDNCHQLVALHIDALVPPTLDTSLGGSIALIFVPKEAVSAYKSATGWNQYTILSTSGTSVNVHVATAGTLGSAITQQGVALTDVSDLVVTGTLNSEDFRVMNKSMTQLMTVDVSGTNIDAIPNSAFEGKTQLLSFKAPVGIKTIGEKAFSGCRLMTDIPFGSQIVSIGNRAFERCSSMTGSLLFPASLSSLGEYAFANCAQLDTIDLRASVALTQLPQSVFSACKGVSLVRVNPQLNGIGYQAFEGCASLQTVDLSECKSISLDYLAFGNCTSLKSIKLPSYINQMSGYAFANCSQLKNVVIYSKNVPSLPDNVFYGVNLSTCELLVPVGSVKYYSMAPNWSSFTTIKEMGLLVNIGSHGVATVAGKTVENGEVIYHMEAAVELKVLPDPGYEVASFIVNGQSANLDDNSYYLAAGQESATFGVTFKLKKFPLQVTVKGNGALKREDTLFKDTIIALSADSASTLVFSVLPSDGFVIDSIRFNEASSMAQKSNAVYVTPILTGPSSLSVQFSPVATLGTFHKVEVVTGKNGSVEYLNTPLIKDTTDVMIPSGVAAVFTLKPNQGYIVDKVSYNGTNVTSKVLNNAISVGEVITAGKMLVVFKVDPRLSLEVKTPGTLSKRLTPDQKLGVTNLTLTGIIDQNDFYFMRDSLEALSVLDISQVTVGHQMGATFYPSYEVPSQAFSKDWSTGKKTLTEIFLPLNTRYIRDATFVNCTNLQHAHLENCTELVMIDYSAFNNTSLRKVSLPATLTSLGSSVFNNCLSLESVD
ncbi:MAG: leucine-rich repeat protein, partial [Bacteroidales bacterium]|nr:leucine-rich repeat protein [Bacteroidales bacterium]